MSPSRGSSSSNVKLFQDGFWRAKEKLLAGEMLSNDTETAGRIKRDKATSIAACFLQDYEAGRPPTLPKNVDDVSDSQLYAYSIKFSRLWKWIFLYPATLLIFVAYFKSRLWTAIIHFYAVLIFSIDLGLRHIIFKPEWFQPKERKTELYIQRGTAIFVGVIGIQTWLWYIWAQERHFSLLIGSLFKPLILFYLSRRARDTLEALFKVTKILTRVFTIELFLILTFAAVGCRLFYNDKGFENLATSWLSLFQLSTTVVNPSLWMPSYANGKANAVFFVLFIVVCNFYLHSLILSVVFQVFIKAASEVHHRSAIDKEDAIQYTFHVLRSVVYTASNENEIPTDLIREVISKVRSHYGELKINVLMELTDPNKRGKLDYATFRSTIRETLNSSVRLLRRQSLFDNSIEMFSMLITIVNFLFVTLLTSRFEPGWFSASVVVLGSLITAFCIIELLMRCNIPTMTYYSVTKLNAIFDAFAALGVAVSLYGITSYLVHRNESALDYLFAGRALDMIRSMRFFPMFRDVVERSVNVLPALAGPVILVITTVHVFVYLGMALWGGQIDVDTLSENESIQYLYYLNNFNSYSEGLVTIFNVLVVNDWHEIARVFLFADRYSQPYIVYSFFVVVVLIAVCIMLNVITAFFVETFVTRLSKEDMIEEKIIASEPVQAEFSMVTPKNKSNAMGRQNSWHSLIYDDLPSIQSVSSSVSSDTGNVVQFEVFARQGIDRIMQTVATSSNDLAEVARCICETLECVSQLFMNSVDIHFLVCCKNTLQHFPSSGFLDSVLDFMDENSLYHMIGDASTRLSASGAPRSLETHYVHPLNINKMLDLSVRTLSQFDELVLFMAKRYTLNERRQ